MALLISAGASLIKRDSFIIHEHAAAFVSVSVAGRGIHDAIGIDLHFIAAGCIMKKNRSHGWMIRANNKDSIN